MNETAVMTDVEHRAFIRRLRADLKEAARTLSPQEVRYLVDLYYQQQEDRKRSSNRVRSGEGEPNALIAWLGEEHMAIEQWIKMAMDSYTEAHRLGRWAKSIYGVGPVLAAGFMSQIDVTKARTAGAIWRFAGLDPTRSWHGKTQAKSLVTEVLGKVVKGEKLLREHVIQVAVAANLTPDTVYRDATTDFRTGKDRPLTRSGLEAAVARRPWNARLKTLAWKFADCQKKFCNAEKSFYGKLYVEYKANLVTRNENGEFAEAAKEGLERVSKSTEAYKHYLQGKLPPGHVDSRAMRWVAKLYLSHFHTVAYVCHYKQDPPKPYAIEHLGHAHIIEVPNWPCE